jgi:uncharacterized protein YjbI with pentapeptide repeats
MHQETMTQDEWENYVREETHNGINNKIDYGITIENKIFPESFLHQGSVGLTIKNCVFEDGMFVTSYLPNSNVYITDCTFKQGLYFSDIESEKDIVFGNCVIEGSATFNKIKISRLDFNIKSAEQVMFGDDSAFGHLQIGGKDRNKFGKFHLKAGIATKRIEINHTEIEDLYIGYSTLETELAIVNTHLNKLTLEHFRNAGSLNFSNCKSTKKDGAILINQSNLGNADFFKFDFYSFGEINVTNSTLYESVFVNCAWSKKNWVSKVKHFSSSLDTPEESDRRVLAANLKDVYKQIKMSFSKQNDYVQEQYFHGLEMNQYYRSLSLRRSFWTKVILGLSFLTSDYGQSFTRPFVSIVLLDCFLFFIQFLLGGTVYNAYDLTHLNGYVNTIASILNFMNPLHKTDGLSGGPFIIDTIGRIFSSYMIYNMIRATRRFVK